MTATPAPMSDPITGRTICSDCWNCQHGTKHAPMCEVRDCHCGCKDAREVQRRERAAHKAARQERKALERKQLEAEDNPLRAINPRYRKPWRTSSAPLTASRTTTDSS
jgi:hypothetical protein